MPHRPLTVDSTEDLSRVSYRVFDQGVVTISGRRRKKTVYTFDTTRLSLYPLIPHPDDLRSRDIFQVMYLLYLYALRLTNTRTIRRLSSVPWETVSESKNRLFADLNLVRLKIATIRCVVQRLTPDQSTKVVANFVSCGLRPEDAIFFYLLYHNNDIRDFVKLVQTIPDATFVLDVNSLADELDQNPKAFESIRKQAGYRAWRKLSFIARGNRFEVADYQHNLVIHAINAYRWVRPFYSKEHAVNYAKQAIHYEALNIIDLHKKDMMMQRTIATEDGFDNVMRDFDDRLIDYDIYEPENTMVDYLDRDTFEYEIAV